MRRHQLFWGVILLLIGGLMLMNEMGIKLPNGMLLTELFWPMLLILGGLWVLVGAFFRGSAEAENATIDLQGATSASLKISHGAGELKIHSGANANELAHGTFGGGLEHKATRSGDRLEVRMRPAKDFMDFPFFGPRTQLDWDVALNADTPTALTLNLGANKSMLDLRDMNITDFDLDTGASDTKLMLPSKGRFHADLDLGAASLEVIVPDGLSARIHASLGVADMRVDESRFPRNGKYYQSPDYDTAANAVDMTIDAGAAFHKNQVKGIDMKRFDPRIVLGFLLLVGGILALLQTMGYLRNAPDIFWGGLILAVGLVFLVLLFGGHWWSAFPGFTLLALGALILLPDSLEDFGGALFLGGIGLSFWYVYFTSRIERWWAIIPACVLTALAVMIVASTRYEDLGGAIFLGGIGLAFLIVFLTNRTERWWALIPAGVLVTLAGVTIAAERFGEFQTAGFFFFGLAVTFLLVALLTGMRWAYWPALALGVMGLLGIASLLEFANYLWAFVLIAAGGFMLFRYFTNRA